MYSCIFFIHRWNIGFYIIEFILSPTSQSINRFVLIIQKTFLCLKLQVHISNQSSYQHILQHSKIGVGSWELEEKHLIVLFAYNNFLKQIGTNIFEQMLINLIVLKNKLNDKLYSFFFYCFKYINININIYIYIHIIIYTYI